MRTLPLHHSQKEIYACDDYADFELALRPTYDFYMKLLSLSIPASSALRASSP